MTVVDRPKLERPRSLSLQQSEEVTDEGNVEQPTNQVEQVDQEQNQDVAEIENVLGKVTLEEVDGVKPPENEDNLTTPTATDGVKKTPSHLTEQGFFDLKFYHNKLW